MIALIVAAALAATPPGDVEALLRVALDGPEMVVAIRTMPEPNGHRLTIDCTAGCPAPIHFAEAQGDTPLGLFQPFDALPVVVATSAGGSAYHVRAYRLGVAGVTRILDTATRSAPGFSVAADGAIVVDTTEGLHNSATALRHVRWTSNGGTFIRSQP